MSSNRPLSTSPTQDPSILVSILIYSELMSTLGLPSESHRHSQIVGRENKGFWNGKFDH